MIPLKDDSPSALKPYVTMSLIAACGAVFAWQHGLDASAGRRAVVAYLLLFPRAKVLTLVLLPFYFTTARLPAMLLLLLWFAVQLASDLGWHGGGTSAAFRAHIGGFLAGMLLVPLLKRRDVPLLAR